MNNGQGPEYCHSLQKAKNHESRELNFVCVGTVEPFRSYLVPGLHALIREVVSLFYFFCPPVFLPVW